MLAAAGTFATPVKIRDSLVWKRIDEIGGVYAPLMGSTALPHFVSTGSELF
jgi:hypothetical protein